LRAAKEGRLQDPRRIIEVAGPVRLPDGRVLKS